MSRGKHARSSWYARRLASIKARRAANRAAILRTIREARLARVMRTAR